MKRRLQILFVAACVIALAACEMRSTPDRANPPKAPEPATTESGSLRKARPKRESIQTPVEKPEASESANAGENAPEASEAPPESAVKSAPPAREIPAPEAPAVSASAPSEIADLGASPDKKKSDSRIAAVREKASAPADEAPPRKTEVTVKKSGETGRLAIIIDDIGESVSQLNPFLDIDADLTFSVIPETRQAKRCLSTLRSHDRQALLHLPMEPLASKSRSLLPSDGITVDLSDDEIKSRVEKDLDALSGVRGVNNHMGSRATQDARVMRDVLEVVKDRGLFFIDSKTVKETVVSQVAGEEGVPTAARTGFFLDDGGDASAAYRYLMDLGEEAKRNGTAIGIGHPHPGTAKAIARAVPELEAMGIKIVPVSELVK